jgi:hypothetical protein
VRLGRQNAIVAVGDEIWLAGHSGVVALQVSLP